MGDTIDWSNLRHAHDVPFVRTVTLAAGTGVVFGIAPTLPASKWTEMNPGFCFRDAVVVGDATYAVRVSVDSAQAARLGDERSQTIAAGKSTVLPGPIGKIAVWNPEAAASVTISIQTRAFRQGNNTGSYVYSTWPLTCDEADLKCDSSVVTVDSTFMP